MATAEHAKHPSSPGSSASAPGDTDLASAAPLPATSEDRDSSPHDADDHMSPSKAKDRDPSKPKRKKARRACAACQRAHLTCSDERPCERCIKRNLADQCQDGTRKKAKYLHDAPNEALMPGHAAKYKHENGTMVPAEQPPTTNGINQQYASQTLPPQNVPMPMREEYKQQYSPASSAFESQPSPLHQVPPPLQQANSSPQSLTQPTAQQAYGPQYMETTDPTGMFNFDIPSMNFGNHHGALEFGMLGNMGQLGQSPQFGYDQTQGFQDNRTDYTMSSADSNWPAKHLPMTNFDPTLAGGMEWRRSSQTTFPHAFAIGTNSNGFAGQSPASSVEFWQNDFQPSATDANMPSVRSQQQAVRPQATPPMTQRVHSNPQPPLKPSTPSMEPTSNTISNGLNEPNQNISKKLGGTLKTHPAFARRRQRDPSFIYRNVNDPYPYTQAFHALTAVILRRFSAKKRVRIAKALASIRPSFISLNRNLTDPDLIFMEQNFQRCIWDYEEDANACGTPTLIIRRTGEVAYADKEFTLLSGWTKDVLYGRAPNRNTNKAAQDANPSVAGSGANTVNSSRGGYNTPRISAVDGFAQNEEATTAVTSDAQPQQTTTSGGKPRPQPVFLAELLDDDSVVDFYEEYSQRAFGDSRGTTSRRCRLLKYKPPTSDSPEDLHQDAKKLNGLRNGDENRRGSHSDDRTLIGNVNGDHGKRHPRPGISSEEGMKRLGDEKGAVDCMYCWMVKQDCFNIPMLIVINFLPIL